MRSGPLVLDLAALAVLFLMEAPTTQIINLTCEKLNEWYVCYINKYAKLMNVILNNNNLGDI